MKITIEENPKSKWTFNTIDIKNEKFKKEIEYHTNQLLKCAKNAFSNPEEMIIFDIKINK